MRVLQSCRFELFPDISVRVHARTALKFSADRGRLSSAGSSGFTNPIALKRKRVLHKCSRGSGQSACTCICRSRRYQTPQAATAGASTEPQPKVVGLGLACWDFLAQVAAFPKPDEKLRTQRMEVCHDSSAWLAVLCVSRFGFVLQTRGGGNCANALTAASRLGTETYLVTKLGKDSIGDQIVAELDKDRVNTQFVLREEGSSSFGYMIVDKQGKQALHPSRRGFNAGM